MLLKDLIADVPSKTLRTRILGGLGGEEVTVAEVVDAIGKHYPLAILWRIPNFGRKSIDAVWPLLQPYLRSPEADIVNRLRADGSSLCIEAAVKIERLRALNVQHVVSLPPQPTTEGFFAMPNHDEQELDTLMDALRELAGRLDEDVDKGLIEEAIKAVEALAELEANGEDEEEPPENENA